jgi:beta-glucanase (GH16 family)
MKLNVLVLAILLAVVQSIFPQAADSPVAQAKWKLVWSDEFNGPAIDKSVWEFEIGHIRNKEPQYYTDRPENSYIEDGNLVIETRMENYRGAPYTSASLNTRGRKAFQYGRIEMRARLPKGNAIWPAFWTMGEKGRWPRCGEIDIMEMWGGEIEEVWGKKGDNGLGDGVTTGCIHYADENGKHASGGQGKYSLPDGAKCADAYHIYAIEWDANEIKWFFDDVNFMDFKIDTDARRQAFHQPHYILVNTAIAPTLKPGPTTDTLPQKYYIDYVRVYERDR